MADDFAKATPRPWMVGHLNHVYQCAHPYGAAIVDCFKATNETKANAALIVAAVNAYDRDRALIRELAEALRQIADPMPYDDPIEHANAAMDIARAALAKVEERG